MVVDRDMKIGICFNDSSCRIITWRCIWIHINELSISFVFEQHPFRVICNDLVTHACENLVRSESCHDMKFGC